MPESYTFPVTYTYLREGHNFAGGARKGTRSPKPGRDISIDKIPKARVWGDGECRFA